MEHDSCRILCASLRLLLFYICFCSLLINKRLVFISYFVTVPLRKGHRGLEYQCLLVRLYLFFFCIFDYLYRDFWFFIDCFLLLPPSFAKTGPQSDIQAPPGLVRSKKKIFTRGIGYNFR